MRLSIDLDGTLCAIRKSTERYEDLAPIEGAVEKLRAFRQAGHYIIITTARNMATCEANVGKVLKNVGKITLEWLDRHGFEYDEIHFGKPNAHIYIDDRAIRFDGWNKLTEDLLVKAAKAK